MKRPKQLLLLLLIVTLCSSSLASARQYEKLLIIGNSMALHYPSEQLSWKGSWGMAASKQENDFSHQLKLLISKKQVVGYVGLRVENISDFERNSPNFSFSKLNFVSEYKPDVVVIFLGDNVNGNIITSSDYLSQFNRFVATVKNKSRGNVYCVSTWWASKAKDEVIKSSCESQGAQFVDISDLSTNPNNLASKVSSNPGVAAHPGDIGMRLIAERIYKKIYNQ